MLYRPENESSLNSVFELSETNVKFDHHSTIETIFLSWENLLAAFIIKSKSNDKYAFQ